MIQRKLDKYIEQHFATNKSALLLKGARQTGKTFAIRKYAQELLSRDIHVTFGLHGCFLRNTLGNRSITQQIEANRIVA